MRVKSTISMIGKTEPTRLALQRLHPKRFWAINSASFANKTLFASGQKPDQSYGDFPIYQLVLAAVVSIAQLYHKLSVK